MSKTSFSNSELSHLHYFLLKKKMLPVEKISVCTDVFNSGYKTVYNVIRFAKGKKQIDIGFVTRTYPRNQKLEEQLIEYFGGEE